MPLHITKRPAQLDELLTVRPKKVKEEVFARFAIPVAGVPINDVEFGELLLDPKAHKKFYKYVKDRDATPKYPMLAPLPLLKIPQSAVAIYLGRRVMKLSDVTLVKNRIVLQEGGTSGWNFGIQSMPKLSDLVEVLLATLGQAIQIEIDCPTYGAQPELPMESEESDEEEDDGDGDDKPILPEEGETVSALGRRIGAAARRKARKDHGG